MFGNHQLGLLTTYPFIGLPAASPWLAKTRVYFHIWSHKYDPLTRDDVLVKLRLAGAVKTSPGAHSGLSCRTKL